MNSTGALAILFVTLLLVHGSLAGQQMSGTNNNKMIHGSARHATEKRGSERDNYLDDLVFQDLADQIQQATAKDHLQGFDNALYKFISDFPDIEFALDPRWNHLLRWRDFLDRILSMRVYSMEARKLMGNPNLSIYYDTDYDPDSSLNYNNQGIQWRGIVKKNTPLSFARL